MAGKAPPIKKRGRKKEETSPPPDDEEVQIDTPTLKHIIAAKKLWVF